MATAPRILLVDDDIAVLQTLAELLRLDGYEVLQASTGEEALRVTKERHPHLVLLDVVLPDIHGTEVCRRIRSDESLQDTFVALISGEAVTGADKLMGAQDGADDYLLKPVSRQDLIARVRTLLRLRDALAALRASEQHYRQLIEALPEAVALLDVKGRFLSINPQTTRMLRFASELDLLGTNAFSLIGSRDRRRVRSAIASTIRSGAIHNLECTVLRRNATELPVELSAALLRDIFGHPQSIITVVRDISERKLAERQIRLLADALESTQELICITDPVNKFIFANRAFLAAHGYAEDEILDRTPEFLYSAMNPPGLCGLVHEHTLKGSWTGEVWSRRKDGSEFPVHLNTSQIRSRDGKVIGLIGVSRDISERKRAEKQKQAFANLAYRLSAAAAAPGAARIILDIASELLGWDAAFVHLYLSDEDIVVPILTIDTIDGRLTPVPPSETSEEPTPALRRVLRHGAQLVHRTGSKLSVRLRLTPFGDLKRPSACLMYAPIRSAGSVIGILSIQSYRPNAYTSEDLQLLQTLADQCGGALQRIRAAEEHERSEDALARSRMLQKAILDNMPDAVWLKDAHGRFLACNKALAKQIGRKLSQLIGRTAADLHLPQASLIAQQDAEVMQIRKPIRFENYLTAPDGHRKWFETIKSPLFGPEGDVVGTVGISRDITLHKILENELRSLPRRILEIQEAERLRVSRELHDGVNQLLASVQMRLRRVRESIPEKPASREILMRCHHLLTQALEENRRIAHDLRPSELDQLGLAPACRHLCKMLGLRTKLSIHCHIEELPGRLSPDVELNLFRIFQEILNNIEKHAHAKKVSVRLTSRRGVVLLRVSDNGCGFDLISAQSRAVSSRGIGLSNISERAAFIGGTCEMTSSPHKGTTILVSVPSAEKLKGARKQRS